MIFYSFLIACMLIASINGFVSNQINTFHNYGIVMSSATTTIPPQKAISNAPAVAKDYEK